MSMPKVIRLGHFYAPAPMSEWFFSVMDNDTRTVPTYKDTYHSEAALIEMLEGMKLSPVGTVEWAHNAAIDAAIEKIKEME